MNDFSIQITPGMWFFGLFNGIGPVRTQSKMVQFYSTNSMIVDSYDNLFIEIS